MLTTSFTVSRPHICRNTGSGRYSQQPPPPSLSYILGLIWADDIISILFVILFCSLNAIKVQLISTQRVTFAAPLLYFLLYCATHGTTATLPIRESICIDTKVRVRQEIKLKWNERWASSRSAQNKTKQLSTVGRCGIYWRTNYLEFWLKNG